MDSKNNPNKFKKTTKLIPIIAKDFFEDFGKDLSKNNNEKNILNNFYGDLEKEFDEDKELLNILDGKDENINNITIDEEDNKSSKNISKQNSKKSDNPNNDSIKTNKSKNSLNNKSNNENSLKKSKKLPSLVNSSNNKLNPLKERDDIKKLLSMERNIETPSTDNNTNSKKFGTSSHTDLFINDIVSNKNNNNIQNSNNNILYPFIPSNRPNSNFNFGNLWEKLETTNNINKRNLFRNNELNEYSVNNLKTNNKNKILKSIENNKRKIVPKNLTLDFNINVMKKQVIIPSIYPH